MGEDERIERADLTATTIKEQTTDTELMAQLKLDGGNAEARKVCKNIRGLRLRYTTQEVDVALLHLRHSAHNQLVRRRMNLDRTQPTDSAKDQN